MFDQLQQWELDRCGKFTASEIHKLLVKGKGGDYFGQGATTYIRLKAAEILTMEPNNGGRINGYALEWGNSHEYEAVARFENETALKVNYFGGGNPKFFEYSPLSGGSPDGMIKDTAIIEVKCPYNSAEHLEHLFIADAEGLKGYYPECYWQMIFNMICTGTKGGYFISYDPRFAVDAMQIKIVPVPLREDDAELIKERLGEAEKQLKVLLQLVNENQSIILAEYDKDLQATIIQ